MNNHHHNHTNHMFRRFNGQDHMAGKFRNGFMPRAMVDQMRILEHQGQTLGSNPILNSLLFAFGTMLTRKTDKFTQTDPR